MMNDPYIYDNGVLINKFGIKNPSDLEAVERVIAASRVKSLPDKIPPTLSGLIQVHKHIFSPIYPWAGEIRKINLKKDLGNNKSVKFVDGPFVAPGLRRFFSQLRCDKHLKHLDANTFSFRAAVYLADLNDLHPFREGNGRVQRIFLQQLGHKAGHTIDLKEIQRKEWISASQDSREGMWFGEHRKMTKLIHSSIQSSPIIERGDTRQQKAATGLDAPVTRQRGSYFS